MIYGDDDSFGLALYLYKHTSDHDRSISQGKSQGQKGVKLYKVKPILSLCKRNWYFITRIEASLSLWTNMQWIIVEYIDCSFVTADGFSSPYPSELQKNKVKDASSPPQERIRHSPTKRHPIHFSVSRFLSSLHPDMWIQAVVMTLLWRVWH